MNFLIIDIICVVFLIITAIIGYKKGFVGQLYDIASFLLVLFLVYWLSEPLASLWMVYPYDATDYIASMVGSMINRLLVGLLLFIGIMIIKKIIGLFVKPVLKGFMHSFETTSFVDSILGLILHVLEGFFTIYLVLVFLFIPFFDQGRQMIEKSYIAHTIVNFIPDVSQSVLDMTSLFKQNQSMEGYSQDMLTRLTLQALQSGLINHEDALKIFEENILNQNDLQSIELSPSQLEQLQALLENSQYSKQQIQDFISQIKE